MRTAAGPGRRDDVGTSVVIDVCGSHTHAAGERRIVRGERARDRAVAAAEDDDVRSNARIRPRDDIGEPVAVDVAGRHEHATGK